MEYQEKEFRMTTENQFYRDLQKFLDTLPGGFQATESGSDIQVLKRLFTPDEARVAVHLTMKPDPIKAIYSRVKKSGMSVSIEELQQILDQMLRKGTLMPHYEGYDETHYCCTDTTSGGMVTLQVDRLTKEFIGDFGSYSAEAGKERKPTPKEHSALRTVPVEKSIPLPEKYRVGDYDDIRKIVKSLPGPIAVANCICRQITRLFGGKCTKTDLEESCIIIGPDHARHYVDMGIGRFITKEEVFNILKKAQEDGLVLQPENSQKPEAICCCCGDCCVFLKNFKQLPRPADMFLSNYYAEVDPELCTGCEECIERCQMEALTMVGGVAVANPDRCIGCGNCVAICPSNASQLRKKEEEIVPVKDKDAFYMNLLSSRRGK
jgi:electron transport complex protein RnfB